MRLGQLARKLSLRPSQLVDFLAEKNIQTEEGSNTRLSDENTQLIVEFFAPESLGEIMKPSVDETPREEQASLEPETVTVEHAPEHTAIEQDLQSEEKPAGEQPEPEVIRVQKIELSGLKVLGKIDLPEPKKKESKPEDETSGQDQPKQKRRIEGKANPARRDRDQRTWRNPLEVQRQHEARNLEEERKAAIEREKEKRKHHYQNKVKQVKQPKRSKPAKEPVIPKQSVNNRPVPKTWVGKFLRWWTT